MKGPFVSMVVLALCLPACNPPTSQLRIAVNGSGSTRPSAGSHSYPSGTAVEVEAVAEDGAAFSRWSGAASETTSRVRVVVDGDVTLVAHFSSSSSSGGSSSGSGSSSSGGSSSGSGSSSSGGSSSGGGSSSSSGGPTGPCSGHGTYAVHDGLRLCDCDPGYARSGKDACVIASDPCAGVTCGFHGTCQASGGAPTCTCEPGFDLTGTACSPLTFPNPIIRYDAPDPTRGPGSTIFTADGAVMVWNDKVYLYADHDEAPQGVDRYVMNDWLLYESQDLVRWESKGVVASYRTFSWATGDAMALQVIERDDPSGKPKFYLYGPLNAGQVIGVAVADRPEGPFRDARGIPLIFLADTANTPATHGWRNLDPTVFIDDDGQAYLAWGNGVFYWVKLEDDMIHLKGETYTVDASGKMQNRSISGVQIHHVTSATLTGYVEAPWLSRHGGLYYLTYAAHGTSGEGIAYATSSSPEGPWQYRGMVIDSVPNSFTVHQSPFDFRGASYMGYHNGALPTGGSYRRAQCLDRLYFNADGTIRKLVQTRE